jgi:hypothetical protein
MVLWLIGVMGLGSSRVISELREVSHKLSFAKEYLYRFQIFATEFADNKLDSELYSWLVERSVKMQKDLAGLGLMRCGFGGFIYDKFPVLVNTIPLMRMRQAEPATIAACEDCLLRYGGVLAEGRESVVREVINPVIWFREGVRLILLFPFYFLNWLGLVSTSFAQRLSNNPLMAFFSGLISIITLIATVIGLVADWQPFLEVLGRILGKN